MAGHQAICPVADKGKHQLTWHVFNNRHKPLSLVIKNNNYICKWFDRAKLNFWALADNHHHKLNSSSPGPSTA